MEYVKIKAESLIIKEHEVLNTFINKYRNINHWEKILNCKLHILHNPFNVYYTYYGNKELDICLLLRQSE